MALINKLNAIGDAIREKTGKEDKLTLEQMPIEIAAIETGGGDSGIPEEAFLLTGDCNYRFAYNGWNWFLENYGDKITTKDIRNSSQMFYSSTIEEVPFDLNFKGNTMYHATSMFMDCTNLKSIGKIINLYPDTINYFFNNCLRLRYLPEFENLNMNYIHSYAYANIGQVFNGCYSLRSIPEDLLKQIYNDMATIASYHMTYYGFLSCYALDEIRGLKPPSQATITSNMFVSTFGGCHRLKDIIFATQDDGTPYIVKWKNQTIDLYPGSTTGVGWGGISSSNGIPNVTASKVLQYNSGITIDKVVVDDASYQALKNDADWCTASSLYSRYNHDSAVNTINSLPDASAYLATAGGTNTIKFYGAAGEKTDGGAINTLTEAEIAVAAAKGWTITLS